MWRIQKLAQWRVEECPSAASLPEGLDKCFTITRQDLPPSLHRCLAATNIIRSPHAGVLIQSRRVTPWQNGKMVQGWIVSAFLRTEKRISRIMGHCGLWALEAILDPSAAASQKVA